MEVVNTFNYSGDTSEEVIKWVEEALVAAIILKWKKVRDFLHILNLKDFLDAPTSKAYISSGMLWVNEIWAEEEIDLLQL